MNNWLRMDSSVVCEFSFLVFRFVRRDREVGVGVEAIIWEGEGEKRLKFNPSALQLMQQSYNLGK